VLGVLEVAKKPKRPKKPLRDRYIEAHEWDIRVSLKEAEDPMAVVEWLRWELNRMNDPNYRPIDALWDETKREVYGRELAKLEAKYGT
jgi:hypothetical protein